MLAMHEGKRVLHRGTQPPCGGAPIVPTVTKARSARSHAITKYDRAGFYFITYICLYALEYENQRAQRIVANRF